jgi:hypothetical protein
MSVLYREHSLRNSNVTYLEDFKIQLFFSEEQVVISKTFQSKCCPSLSLNKFCVMENVLFEDFGIPFCKYHPSSVIIIYISYVLATILDAGSAVIQHILCGVML